MHWYELAVTTAKEVEEAVANILNEHGANGVVIDDATEINKEHDSRFGEVYELDHTKFPHEGVRVKAYFPMNEHWETVFNHIQLALAQLKERNDESISFSTSVTKIAQADWENDWKKYYTVQKVSDKLIIVPEWKSYERENDQEIVIKMDPGMAFGTGDHPTTILSLIALERFISAGDTVIDVGTGSGILSIASALLGAKKVFAYDLDPVAVSSARNNCQLNNVKHIVTVAQNDLLKNKEHQADVIVANILAHIIIDLIEDVARVLVPGGIFITSGIIAEKASEVKEKLLAHHFSIYEINEHDRWLSIIAKKKA